MQSILPKFAHLRAERGQNDLISVKMAQIPFYIMLLSLLKEQTDLSIYNNMGTPTEVTFPKLDPDPTGRVSGK